jgi:Ca2+-binding EF-hand superfamily protein
MQKRTKIALIALAGLVAVGGVAAASQGWKHGMRGHGHVEFTELAERYDADKDGKISQTEIDTNRANWLTEFDADKSGSLALAEFQNLWLKAQNQRMVREFQRFDTDANGQVTMEEYKNPLAGIVARMDSNQDSALSKDDMPTRMKDRKKGHGEHGQETGTQ